jgi:type I restriction enzyme S subunit
MKATYPSYRSSGLPWAPKLPSHWSIVRAKNLASLIQTGPFGSQLHNHDYVADGTPVINPLHLVAGRIRPNTKARVAKEKVEELSRHKLRIGDIVFARRGDLGRSAVVTEKEIGWLCGTGSVLFRPITHAVHPEFLSQLIETSMYKGLLVASSVGSTMANLNPFTLSALPIVQPPRPEQDQIVAYLRARDAHIARFIKAKRDLMGLITEQKLRIIDCAVTRGLDASVKLKRSGIEWLGDVPEHWQLRRLKFVARNVTNQTSLKAPEEIYLALEHVDSWTGVARPVNGAVDFASTVKKFSVDDVLFGKLRPYLAKVTRATRRGVCVSEFLVLRPYDALILPAYFEQLLRSKRVIDLVNSSTFGAKMPRADWSFMGNVSLPVPPADEQASILAIIARETKDLDDAVQRAEEEIKLIREYRDRLIVDVVTGQVDVRGWTPGPDDVVIEEDLAALCDNEETDTDGEDGDGGD